jgi:hemolysin activation/secretion protein
MCFFPSFVFALDFLPATVSPERQSPLPQTPPSFEKPQPTIERQAAPQPPVSESAKSIKFVLKKVVIKGNTIFSAEDLQPFYSNLIGKKVTLVDMQNVAESIEKHYLEAGYMLTRVYIPPQEIDEKGVVTLVVVEGFVDKFLINGNMRGIQTAVEQYLQVVLEDKPLNIKTLERALLLINDLPGVSAKAVLTPSLTVEGASSLVVLLTEHYFDGSVTWDNRGTIYLGPEEFSISASLDNIFGTPGQATFNAKAAARTQEFTSYMLDYKAYIAPSGASFDSSFTQNRTHPGSTFSILDVYGLSSTIMFIYTHPIIRTRRINLNATLDYDYLDSRTDTLGVLVTLDRLDSLRAGLNLKAQDAWDGVNALDLQFSQGFQGISGPPQPLLLRSRFEGKKDYTKITSTFTRVQYFSENTVSIYTSLNGQYAFTSLLSPEQLGYGGAVYGSAYDPSEIVGDSGFEGKIELRYNDTHKSTLFPSVQYFTSYDWGVMWYRVDDPLTNKQSGTSAAVGVRLGVGSRVNGEIEVAKPLTKPVAAFDDRNGRIFFSLSVDLSER